MSEKEKIEIKYDIKKEVHQLLGKGAFFSVFEGRASKYKNDKLINDNEIIALKEISKDSDEEKLNSIYNELIVSTRLKNDNIVKLIECIDIDNKSYIAYEYCNGGDLRKYMDYFKNFDEELIQVIMSQIVNGLSELFQKDVVHHDIKPENILLKLFYNEENLTPESMEKYQIIKGILKSEEDRKKSEKNYVKNNLINNMYYNANKNMNRININNNYMMNINNNYQNQFNQNNFCPANNNNNPTIYYNNMINQNNFYMNNNTYYNNLNNNNYMNNNYYMNNNNNINNNNMNININNINNNNINDIKKEVELHFKESDFIKILKDLTEYKLSDFGLSKLRSEIRKQNIRGSLLYMSPELIKINSNLTDIENRKIDIWSLGVLAYELFFGKRPFEAFSLEELSQMYERGIYLINLNWTKEKKISKEFFLFLNMCLQKDPEKRANVLDLKKCDFLNLNVDYLEKMDQKEFKAYLKDTVLIKENQEGTVFSISINKNYAEELKK